jgi:hypothetical protein
LRYLDTGPPIAASFARAWHSTFETIALCAASGQARIDLYQ